MHFQHAGHRLAYLVRLRHAQLVIHVDPPNDKHAAVLLNLANHLCDEILGLELYRARPQRAGKCARESATCRRNDVVDGRGMRLDLRHVDAVMLRDGPVNTKKHGLALRGQRGRPCWASQTSDFDSGLVGDF